MARPPDFVLIALQRFAALYRPYDFMIYLEIKDLKRTLSTSRLYQRPHFAIQIYNQSAKENRVKSVDFGVEAVTRHLEQPLSHVNNCSWPSVGGALQA